MFFYLAPDALFTRIEDITGRWLTENGIAGLIIDLDNTLAEYHQAKPPKPVADWFNAMHATGVGLVVLSNNREDRVATFCDGMPVEHISRARKPRRGGYLRAAQVLGLDPARIAVVGDQIFTDVWGARRSGMMAVCVEPIKVKGNLLHRVRRWAETPFLKLAKGGKIHAGKIRTGREQRQLP